ncbi:glycosyltransferase [Flavobacteriaceae bacterium]|nr:glycosyltransferase [Flavobacteriaceae bacterium]
MKIPKVIHYCWFGPKPIPELELKCIESWTKYLPDYKLMFWNEDSFDINSHSFSKQAYENNYFAFVSDYVRAEVLKEYGGIYLDTDFEILSNFTDLFSNYEVVLGFENSSFVGTAMMASIPNHSIFQEFTKHYRNLSFINQKGKIQITANPAILAEILKKFEINLNGESQLVKGVYVYHRNLFFPKKLNDNSFRITEETVGIHHFEGSWLTDRQKKRGQNVIWIEVCRPLLRKIKDIIYMVLGESKTKNLENNIRNFLK